MPQILKKLQTGKSQGEKQKGNKVGVASDFKMEEIVVASELENLEEEKSTRGLLGPSSITE